MLGGTAEVSNTEYGGYFFSPFHSNILTICFLSIILACMPLASQASYCDRYEGGGDKKEVDTKVKEDARGDGRGK